MMSNDDLRHRYEERAAIKEYCGGLPRDEAEHEAWEETWAIRAIGEGDEMKKSVTKKPSKKGGTEPSKKEEPVEREELIRQWAANPQGHEEGCLCLGCVALRNKLLAMGAWRVVYEPRRQT